jgi:hypothetical protein
VGLAGCYLEDALDGVVDRGFGPHSEPPQGTPNEVEALGRGLLKARASVLARPQPTSEVSCRTNVRGRDGIGLDRFFGTVVTGRTRSVHRVSP